MCLSKICYNKDTVDPCLLGVFGEWITVTKNKRSGVVCFLSTGLTGNLTAKKYSLKNVYSIYIERNGKVSNSYRNETKI